jgi:YVTN family beta-propeller protein
MRCGRTLKVGLGLALLLPLLAIGGPASAQRSSGRVGAVAVPTGSPRAYVSDPFGGVVWVVDLATNTTIDSIPVDFPFEVTARPDGRQVWVIDGNGTVTIIDTATNTVIGTVAAGAGPLFVAFSPDSTKAYVVDSAAPAVVVLNTATLATVTTIPLPEGSNPGDIAVSPDGALAYVPNGGLASVSVINTATNTVTTTIPVGANPVAAAFSPSGTRAYVSNHGDNTVSVINTATNAVVATVPVGASPFGLTVTPDGTKVYVGNSDDFSLSVISTATNTVIETIYTSSGGAINVEATDTRVYMTPFAGSLVVVDQASGALLAPIAIGEEGAGSAWGLAVLGSTPRAAATPTISTQASAATIAGGIVRDTATVAGGANPTGDVVFRLYDDAACSSLVTTSIKPLVGSTATADPYIAGNAGTYRWRAVYEGDANNNPADTTCNDPNETVVVSPFGPPPFTRTISGDFAGPLTVNAGESVQLLNARVVGPVTVNPGGALTVTNSQISRGIVANSPGFMLICGSQISGPSPNQALGISNSITPFRIGDQARGCAGNRFAGSVNLTGNTTSTFSNNIVVGNVTVNNNGPGATLIFNNNIMGNLACAGNNPPPQTPRVLQRNTVSGARSGQCTGIFI